MRDAGFRWRLAAALMPGVRLATAVALLFLTVGSAQSQAAPARSRPARAVVLLEDDFGGLAPGMFSAGVVGAHAEYHYLPALAPKDNWVVSAFKSEGSQRAWRLIGDRGQRFMQQAYLAPAEERSNTHPIVIAGDALWSDYTLETSLAPESGDGQSGIVFRYRNDRAYYLAGVLGAKAFIKKVNGGAAFRKLDETILAERPLAWKPGEPIPVRVTVIGGALRADFGAVRLEARDAAFPAGKIGFTSDVPTRFGAVRVTCSREAKQRLDTVRAQLQASEAWRIAKKPRMVLWKKLATEGLLPVIKNLP
jgi:rhamnogalacturonan endolyase